MKIAIPSTGPSLYDMVEVRMEISAYFIIYDLMSGEFEVIPNSNSKKRIDSGILAVQFLLEKGVSVVLTGYCNMNVLKAFNDVNIQVLTGVSGFVRKVIQQYNKGFFKNFMNMNTEHISA